MKKTAGVFAAIIFLSLITGCGRAAPTAVPAPTRTQVPATATSTPPTNTLVPPTVTPVSPTATAFPTDTSEPTSTLFPLPTLTGSGGGVIAFSSRRAGNDEIYVMNADGSDQRNLTKHPSSDSHPAWSPDGSQIAFSSDRDRNLEIYVMDSDGTNLRRLTNNPAIDDGPVWSPNGNKIAFISLRDGNVEVYLANADGSGLRRITRNNYDDFEIDWSPDGTLIAASSQVGEYADIYTINIETALQGTVERHQLTDTDAHDAFPKWSPDGSKIAFISNREGDENWEIYIMDADGSNQRRLTYSDSLDGIPGWSPDGTQIAFESNRDGDNEIYVLRVEEALQNPGGVEILRLTNNNTSDMQPVWRPEQPKIEPALNIEVPEWSAPVINGRFSEGEWDGALTTELTNGGKLFLMHNGGYLYLGIRSRAMGFGSICAAGDNQVSILHSSAGLGTAIFERDGNDWLRIQQFSYCCWEATQSELDEFLKRDGWVASVGTKGVPEEMEYQIAMNDGSLTLAVVYVDDFTFETALYWPEKLDDDCLGLALIPEDPPEQLLFSPEEWVTIIAAME